uniref:Tight junction protein 3 n=1 Tax=Denticeps clupeoides TaxID=299321 RepID=A0AAY4ECV2_9TELE
MEDMTIWEQHTITLNKDPKMGFGFALSGGRDKPNPDTGDVAVVVSDVIRNGPAMGRLQTKDLIVMVNGVSMENVTSNYTIQHLKSCGKTANVTVKRPRVIQIPVSNRPARSGSQSNLLSDEPNYRRPRQGSDTGSYDRLNRRDQTPDRNGHDLPLMSGYKRLPNQEVPSKPMKATLVKKKPTDEYGMKLGSQIFIKHMTATGLAAKEGTLQEGDLVLKINGMTTENLSLLETKHLVEKSKGKLTMVVLRDDRKFLVTIPEVADSPQNSEDEGREDSSSELEGQGVPSESESDHSNSPPPARRHNFSTCRILTGISTLPNPRASPIPESGNTYYLSSPAVSESDSDRSASPPPRRDNHMRYKYDLFPRTFPNYFSSDSESESDSSSGPTKRQVVPANQDSVRLLYFILLFFPFSYSSDQNVVQFVKDGSVGLRLVGGNDVGIFVGGVQPNSPAQKQGMREGDQIINVNGKDFNQFTREEAAMFMLNVRSGETIKICTQNKMDIYKKILKSSIGDAFYIRTHFDREAEVAPELAFTRGEVFRVLDTMHRGKLGNWLAVRMGNDLHELDKGTIPNQARAETMASIEQAQRATTGERQGTGPRAEFWKLRGLRGAKKNTRRTRDDLLQLTIQGKFPAYEKVLLREANFKRPIVILGPLNDIAMEKLAREMPDEFEVAEMVPRSGGDSSSSTVIKLDTVRTIAEQDKHPLLDITPTAVERLNYIQYHPIVLFLDPHSRKDVKVMRQRQAPDSNKSSRRLYAQALKIRKHYSHLFSARIDLQPNSNVWYELLKERIRHQQSKPVWVSEVNLERGGEEELDALSRDNVSDYLSCDSRAASDYEDTDGEPYTDAELYTDNEDLEEPLGNQEAGLRSRHRGSALARSSEPATGHGSPEPLYHPEPLPEEEPTYNLPPEVEATPVLHPVYHSARPAPKSPPQFRKAPSTHSFSDSDFSLSDLPPPDPPTEEPPDFRAPDPSSLGTGSATPPPESPPPHPEHFNAVADRLAHHEAVQCRRTHIQGSDSSENNNDDENEDIEWGPATEL